MAKTKNNKRQTNIEEIKKQFNRVASSVKDGVFTFTGPLTIQDFTSQTKISVKDVFMFFFAKAKVVNINTTLTDGEIAELAINFKLDFNKSESVDETNFMDTFEIIEKEEDLIKRAPIITIMGHVDHGKTTLIDTIRKANVVSTEHGGITQHTGAYQVDWKGNKITFLDTPGHEAFAAMRVRGTKVTDIVILVVAGDDGVKPQTKEAAEHALAAKVPLIVFVNKMDKPGIDKDKILSELSKIDVVSEEWGGDNIFVYGSALKNQGIDKLFDAVLLQAELLELKSNPNRLPIGTIIESRIDTGRGSIATIIVENGTVYARDFIVAGSKFGRIKILETTEGKPLKLATPGMPAQITGLNYAPAAGEKFIGIEDEKFAKEIANKKGYFEKQNDLRERNVITDLDGSKSLNLIVKADTQGSAEAVKHSLQALTTDEVSVNVVRSGVGAINKSDIVLAQASNSIIYGFNIRITAAMNNLATQENIKVKTHQIIYKIIEEVEALLGGMKAPVYEEKITGEAEILKIFSFSKVGNIAGCKATDGFIEIGSKMRLLRDGKVIHESLIKSLRRQTNDINKVLAGNEFGMTINKFNDVKEGDLIQTYEEVQV